MILRRLATALRKQDWFTVLIETVIVIFGVFIGLQVNNWNEARTDRAKEAQVLQSLISDFDQMKSTANRAIAFHKRAIGGLEAVLIALETADLRESEREAFEVGLRFGYRTAAVNAMSPTLVELTSSGQVGLLQDPVLRKALTEYELFRVSAMEGQRNSRLAVSEYVRDFTARFNYDLETDRPGTFDESTWAFELSDIGEYDFEAMVGDEAFLDAVYELREMQKFDLNWHANTLVRIEAVQAILSGDATVSATAQ